MGRWYDVHEFGWHLGNVGYYRWSKELLEAGKKRLQGATAREATSHEVTELRHENAQLKQLAAEVMLKNRVLKKSLTGSALEELDT